ncbi:MAG: hypothetical protein CMK32_03050 [Porticoccaceae bacterium]|nr:hypothetical protein [Porticoccaceae bacterium]|tara:strand:+ start:3568 stop:3870 length:303 start_codon:yes stop_codon:yes gene_type:complete
MGSEIRRLSEFAQKMGLTAEFESRGSVLQVRFANEVECRRFVSSAEDSMRSFSIDRMTDEQRRELLAEALEAVEGLKAIGYVPGEHVPRRATAQDLDFEQ